MLLLHWPNLCATKINEAVATMATGVLLPVFERKQIGAGYLLPSLIMLV